MAAIPHNILVLGTDVRSDELASPEAQSDECVDQASRGSSEKSSSDSSSGPPYAFA